MTTFENLRNTIVAADRALLDAEFAGCMDFQNNSAIAAAARDVPDLLEQIASIEAKAKGKEGVMFINARIAALARNHCMTQPPVAPVPASIPKATTAVIHNATAMAVPSAPPAAIAPLAREANTAAMWGRAWADARARAGFGHGATHPLAAQVKRASGIKADRAGGTNQQQDATPENEAAAMWGRAWADARARAGY